MDLETWLEKNEADLYEMGTVEEIATAAWQAAQAAERERTKELVECLKLAIHCHGCLLTSDPPVEAWKYHQVSEKARAAIAKYEDDRGPAI